MKTRGTLAVGLILAVATTYASEYDFWDKDYTSQALLGAVQFENLKFKVDDSTSPKEVDLSLLPQLGGAWTTLPKESARLQYGLECSFLLGFQFDKINYIQAGGSGLYVSVSTSMWMFDLAGGGYASLFLDPKHNVRIYAGGGPLMMYADYRADKEYDDGTTPDEDVGESAFGIGLYARTGIEFRLYEKGMLGVGARGSWSTVDFSDVGGRSELVGTALFVTFTAGL